MIIWIASYPKSGNTWIRALLSSYLYSKDGVFNFELLKKIVQFPDKAFLEYFLNDFSDIKKVSNYWIAAQDRLNLYHDEENIFFKTHSALCTLDNNIFTNKSNTKAVIYVVRDPRNVITSTANHFSLSIEEAYTFLTDSKKLLTEGKHGTENFGVATVLGSWSDHYKSWLNIKFAPILIVKYENLMKDPINSFIAVLNFLKKFIDIKIDEKKILNSVSSCSFENMVEMEKKHGFKESAESKEGTEKVNFFYLGKKNNWKNLLNTEIEKKIRKVFSSEMKDLGYI